MPNPDFSSELNQAILFVAMNGFCVLDVTTLSDEECLVEIRKARQAAKERAEREGDA